MAARIEAIAGESHMAARFSEHGFALLCHGVNHDRTQALADKIRHAFSDHIIEAGDRSVSVTVSIGGVQIGERIASLNQVLTKARSEEHTSELQSLMRISYAVFCLTKKKHTISNHNINIPN